MQRLFDICYKQSNANHSQLLTALIRKVLPVQQLFQGYVGLGRTHSFVATGLRVKGAGVGWEFPSCGPLLMHGLGFFAR
eukprot:2737370-Amphidinium_carterae.1